MRSQANQKPSTPPPAKPSQTHSQVSRQEVERDLLKNQSTRSELRKVLNIPVQIDPYGKKLNEAIKHHLDNIPNKFGTGFYEPEEVFGSQAKTKAYWGEKHLKDELSKDGWTKEEVKERDRRHSGHEWFQGYFKKKFGAK